MTAPADRLQGPAGGHAGSASPLLSESELLTVAEAARWAPSIHNSQPWRLQRLPNGVAIREDLQRALPVIDPSGRERLISCGCAILNARVALRGLGHLPQVAVLPDPADPGLLATVRSVGDRPPTLDEELLARAVHERHTHRRVYRSHVVAEEDLLELRQVVATEGARLSVADAVGRRRLAELLHRAVVAQTTDQQLRAEVEHWVRRGGADHTDGIPSHALGTSPFPVDSLVHGTHRGTPDTADVDDELARSTVLVVSTRQDTRHDWLVAGMALEHLLLTATAKGLVATFTDQALQDPATRPQVAEILEIWGHPQVLLRVGRALVDAPRTPRRPLADLLD